MARSFPYHFNDHSHSLPLAAAGLFISVFALVALCAKRASKRSNHQTESEPYEIKSNGSSPLNYTKVPKSPLATPKRLLSTISNLSKAKKINMNNEEQREAGGEDKDAFGDGGLWQKNILMGEKCQPLEFSGVIYYDHAGNRISEMPRSPRASAASSLHSSFSFPVSNYSH